VSGMNEFERQLRADLQVVAAAAPTPKLVLRHQDQSNGVARPRHGGWLVPVLAAVACVAAVSAAVAAPNILGGDGTTAEVRSTTTSPADVLPDQQTQLAVARFVDSVSASYGSQVFVSTDWETGAILVGVAPPIPDELNSLDGTSVAGLRVQIFEAAVTVSDYEAFIKAVDRADFPGKERVCSFSLPGDSAAIQVNVTGLSEMTSTEAADLQTHLQALTQAAVVLREARDFQPSACSA